MIAHGDALSGHDHGRVGPSRTDGLSPRLARSGSLGHNTATPLGSQPANSPGPRRDAAGTPDLATRQPRSHVVLIPV